MKKNYTFKNLFIVSIFISFLGLQLNAQTRSEFYVQIGAAIPVGSFTSGNNIIIDEFYNGTESFYNGAIPGPGFTFGYGYFWDGVFTPKDALGIFADATIIWNPVKKSIRELSDRTPSYLTYSIAIGPKYCYYLGASERISVFGQLGITLGSTSQLKGNISPQFGVGGIAGAGVGYMEWLTAGLYFTYFGNQKIRYSGIETNLAMNPMALQIKVGFHF